jgi:oligoribonuclease (3'-5' exoribonuclease)
MDVEAGGIGLDKSLLTVYFEVLDENLETLGELDLAIRHDVYHVTAIGMAINKIDLVAHHQTAIPQSEAGKVLLTFLQKFSDNGKIKLIPVGHGVSFDLTFIWEHLLGRKTFEAYTSYRKLDTAVIAQFLKLQGKLPEYISGSLKSLVEYYNPDMPFVKSDNAFHTAKFDTQMTIEVLRAQIANNDTPMKRVNGKT